MKNTAYAKWSRALTALVFSLSAFHTFAFDPTVPGDALSERLKTIVADSQALEALVVGAKGDGVALVDGKIVRRGSRLAETVDGVNVELEVKSITERGVELDRGAMLKGSFSPLEAPENPSAGFLRYIEAENVPVAQLMRLIADQSGTNIAISDSTRDKPVSIFLRNVNVDAAVEEICRASGLWFRREKPAGTIRITSMQEYTESLNSFREESTEMFTLLYPNVIEVASVIYGLYPDRTLVSLGEEEFDEDDEYDLSRRFRRFRVLEDNGGSQFMQMEAPQTSSSGSRSGSGNFSFSRGSAISRLSQWEQLGDRNFRTAASRRSLAWDDAALIDSAQAAGDTNLVNSVRARATGRAANIFVSMSRKNNMLIVRTSDSRVMDEIRALVKRMDVPTPMVLMEVKVMELAIDDDYEASFSYSFNRGTHTLGHNGSGANNIFSDIIQSGQSSFNPTFAFKAISDNITAQVSLMQEDGKVKTLATPTLLVANNEVSRIFSGKEYPLVSGWTQGDTVVSDSGIVRGSATVEITKEDVGTMLLITPNINADKTVTLRLVQENSEVSAEKVLIPVDGGTGDAKPIDYVESRSIAGTFVANDGMTIIAGGLVKETESERYWRTPVLGSIPLLGWLFRGTEKIKERTELIVLIKPHVILTPFEGGKVSSELLEALSSHPAADGRSSLGTHKPSLMHNPSNDIENITR